MVVPVASAMLHVVCAEGGRASCHEPASHRRARGPDHRLHPTTAEATSQTGRLPLFLRRGPQEGWGCLPGCSNVTHRGPSAFARLPIGSGIVERANTLVVEARLTDTGMQ